MRTRRVRGGFDLNRTLNESPRHRLAGSAATPKEKHPFLFKKKLHPRQIKKARSVFLSGFCPPSIRAVWRGFNADSVLPKLFSGGRTWQNLG